MIFVTGGTGLLGNCIVRELCQRNIPVRALCRAGTSREAFADLDVQIVEGDLSEAGPLEAAIADCEAVIHSAALIHIGWEQLQASREVNVTGTSHIAHACQKQGAKLVYVSTVDTLPAASNRQSPIDESASGGVPKTNISYVVSKREAEQSVWKLAADSDLHAVVVHPGFMLGPFDWKPSSGRMFLEVSRAPVVAAPPGGCSVCDARDVAAAIVNASQCAPAGRNYILAGENLTYQELWSAMLRTTGSSKRVFRLSPIVMKTAGCLIDSTRRILNRREGDVNGGAIAMGCLNHFYDSSRAEAELNYRRRPLEETLTDAWQWLCRRWPDRVTNPN